jgi:hypothetical protein
MNEFELKFRDFESKNLIHKMKDNVLPFANDVVLLNGEKFLVSSRVISYELRIAIVYGKIIE